MRKSIMIYHLYPKLLNLYADKGNVSAIKMRCERRGIDAEIKTLEIGDAPDFSGADIVIFGGGSAEAVHAVKEQKELIAGPLNEYICGGGVMLSICEGFSLLGEFGALDVETMSSDERCVGDIAIEAKLNGKSVTLVGFENHTSHIDIKGHEPLGKVIFGGGNDGSGACEGVIYKNVIATRMYGPILPKNPELADYLIKKALDRKYGGNNELAELDDSVESMARVYIIEKHKR